MQLLEAVPEVGVQSDLRPGEWCFSLVSLYMGSLQESCMPAHLVRDCK